MATTLYLNAANTSVSTYNALTLRRGFGLASSTTTTVASNVGGIIITATGGGRQLLFMSPPVSSNQNITASSISFNIWGREAATTTNAGLKANVYRWSANSGSLTSVVNIPVTAEMSTTILSRNNAATPAANTWLSVGDRIVVIVLANAAGGTMAASASGVTIGYSGPTAGANGDSFVTFTDNFVFQRTTNST